MEKVKTKSFRKYIIKYNIVLVFLMIVTFIISLTLDDLLHWLGIFRNLDDTRVGNLFLIMMIVEVLFLNLFCSHRFSLEVKKVTKHINQLQDNDLSVDFEHSKVTEMEEILGALELLKNKLSESLEEQWRMEEHKQECIICLGHDMKAPIAVLKGNSELLAETSLDEMQLVYNQSNLDNIERMQQYIEVLMDVFHKGKLDELVFDEHNMDDFLEKLLAKYQILSKKYNIAVQTKVEECGVVIFDTFSLERVIDNIIMNAFSYSKEDGTICMTVKKQTEKVTICIEDSGDGFSKEMLNHATEAFVRGDKSRTTKDGEIHLGLGLYHAEKLMQNLGGELIISNSETLGGGKITIILKVK